jgi:hypothetical protein
MNINNALIKLNQLLPLNERQRELHAETQHVHRKILHSFANTGQAPENIKQEILNELADNDLVVLDGITGQISGAYPFSLRKTAHHVFNENINLYAMCAFDAIAIAPLFNLKINTVSSCHISEEKINILQHADKVITTSTEDIYIGIHWQSAGSCAAENLCMEMVFLKNKKIAQQWQADESFCIFPLDDAISFAVSYFKPLLQD